MAHKFNGVDVRTPTSFSWNLEEIETAESGITLDGLDHSDILATKAVLAYSWLDPAAEEVATILTLVKQGRYVTITYPDPETNTYLTKEFKPTGKSAPFRDLRVGAKLYSVLSLSFRER
jgi:hypothetical protein